MRSSSSPITIPFIVLLLSYIILSKIPDSYFQPYHPQISNDPHSIYVPGSGFAGFWFTLGRLHSMKRLEEKNFYCYSSGCLGVLSVLTNTSVDDMMDHAFTVKNSWKNGEITTYDIVPEFVNRLITAFDNDGINGLVLDRLNIITTTFGVGTNIQKANTTHELREMLLQTTFIPFITGKGLSIEENGNKHIDGGFSRYSHPKCQTYLAMPFRMDFIWTLSPNLSKEKVLELWNAGFSHDFV